MKEERSQELAEKAVKLADLWIRKRLPWLGGALMVPVNEWLESDVSGTDGVRIFWNPDEVCRFFEESTAKLARQISASSASWVISSPSAGRKRGRRTLVAGM